MVAVLTFNCILLADGASATHAPATQPFSVTPTQRWAGYYESMPRINSASATWRVPALHCRAGTTLSSTWVGVGGLDGSVLLQAGLFDNCLSGMAENGGFGEVYPGSTKSFAVVTRPGDKVTATVSLVGGTWQARVTDDTTRQSEMAPATSYAGGGTAEGMTEAYGEPTYVMSNFGTERFSRVSVNGSRAKAEQAWSMRGAAGSVRPTNPKNEYQLIYG